MAHAVVNSPEEALDLFRFLAGHEVEYDAESLRLGDWVRVDVYLPTSPGDSVITPPFMEAFLDLQKQLLQFVALAKTGAADIRQLSESDRHQFLVAVHVSGGSSKFRADLQDALQRALTEMVGKMNGRHAVMVILGLGVLVAAGWAWSAWLENERVIRLEELKSQDHQEALQALSFAQESQVDLLKEVVELLKGQGLEGERAVESANNLYESLLRAASKSGISEINGQELSGSDAESLRTSARQRPSIRYVKQEVRVVDINTQEERHIVVTIRDEWTGDQHRMKFEENLFSDDDRARLFQALDTRDPLWVELLVREARGEVRSVEIIRVIDDPTQS